MMTTLAIVLTPFLMAFLIARVSFPNVRFEFDFDTSHGTFSFIYDRYAKIAWMIFGFGMAGSLLFSRFGDGMSTVFLLSASIYALLYNLWLTLSYESYLHSRYPRDGSPGRSTYTLNRYCLTWALGVSAVVLFIFGSISAMIFMRM